MRWIDRTGKRYNRLVFVKPAEPTKFGPGRWWLKCDCGTVFVTLGKLVVSGKTKSCGCYRREKCSERTEYMREVRMRKRAAAIQ